MILRRAVQSALIACLPAVALAEGSGFSMSPVELIEAGIFCPRQSTGREEAPGTERGYIDLIEGESAADFVTTVVPGELGIGFGVRFKTEDGTGSRTVQIVTAHPPFGTPPVTEERYWTTVYDDSSNVSLFTFDYPYEVALGEWTFAVELDGAVVLEQSFMVVPPEDSAVSASMCKGPALMS